MLDDPSLAAGQPDTENARLDALRRYQILDTGAEERFDAITRVAVASFRAPIALVSLVTDDRQWFKSCVGLTFDGTPREHAFCARTIETDAVLVVRDASRDRRFRDNPLVTGEPFIRFYAGAPLITPDGHRLGSLCIIDRKPRRSFSAQDERSLKTLAGLVVDQMGLRRGELSRAAVVGFTEATELAMLSVTPDSIIRFANRAAAELFGYAREELLGGSLDLIMPPHLHGAHAAMLTRVAAEGASKLAGRTVEVVARRKDRTEVPVELSLSLWRDERGFGLGAIVRDITERRARDTRLLRLAHHDELTGLCNRHRFEALLTDLYECRADASVLLLGLDGFKGVNDGFGHAVGDALLQALAIRLPGALPSGATLARFGGDAFAVLLPGVGDPLAIERVGSAMLSALAAPFTIDDQIIRLDACVGFALTPGHGADAEELMASADLALHQAKQEGGGRVRMYTPEMRRAARAHRETLDALRRALRQGELVLHYQPQVCLRSGRLVGAEALIRWQHPQHGLVLPGAFLPAIETSALALSVGAWVLDEACRQMAAWRAAGLSIGRVGVNLFSAQFQTGDLAEQVLGALARHGLAPGDLELEVTERVTLQDDERVLGVLRELHARGVRIAFDDFGTGYASLSTLKRFPLTVLKIDRAFVRDLLTDADDAAITRAIVVMSNELGLETVAEGIETAEHEVALRVLGCRVGQGFRYGRAMPAADLATLAQGESGVSIGSRPDRVAV